ncbi:trehalose utilization protein ThuA [Staphylococcus gallinarum]|uniref:Trehalose utilization protein ThuA n=1 Tax=Staphylococcus gallinarum TaxID=1293 RepID=A0A3A0VMT2_STAGA|nr:ThuA domain-containing protein [Staphylococcus gallinarum]RIP36057.1 trehalose utilization protein ThuA [Staphylococcus gallinarum]
MRITIWNEYRHEQENEEIRQIYPDGIHNAIGDCLKSEHNVTTATLDEPEHGLTDERLNDTDVLIWWGHKAHEEVSDEVVAKVKAHVLQGMGLIVLHSGHFSKIFKSLMGTSCDLKWRESDDTERLWVVDPTHPITESLSSYVELQQEEMYGEHFDIPTPDETVFISWFEGGEVFRSGVTYKRGKGKVFYFRPGHESYPTYYNKEIQQVIKNAVNWAQPLQTPTPQYGNAQALEKTKKN